MGHIMDADALYRIIWLERVVGGHHVPSVARMRHLSICHARLYCRSTALVCHRACRWVDGGWLCAVWAGAGSGVSDQNHCAVLSNAGLGDIICLCVAV